MSGFDAGWLELREPIDAASRSAALARALAAVAHGRRPLRVLDLGAGTGANLRYLAPRLGGAQQWRLLDNDRALLAAIAPRMRATTTAAGWTVTAVNTEEVVSGPGFECRFTVEATELAGGVAALPFTRDGLVTASALLDLVSVAWLEALLARCRELRAPVLFALSYDGRIGFEPAEPEDADVRALVNRHQRSDKGFGPALGPAAAPTAADLLERLGYVLRSARSDWRLSPADAALQRALLDGWLAAASATEPAGAAALRRWHRRRRAHVAAGRSQLAVGHVDLLGTLPDSENPLEPAGA